MGASEEDSEDWMLIIGDYVVKKEDSGLEDDWELIGAIYCHSCEMWLAGPSQWEDHKIGKTHRKNLQQKLIGVIFCHSCKMWLAEFAEEWKSD